MSIGKIMRLERSKRRVLLGAIIFIVGVALYGAILSPYSGELLAACQHKKMLSNAIHKTAVLGATIKTKREKEKEMAEEFNRRQNELFSQNEVKKFLGSLQAIARGAGCTIQSVSSVAENRQGRQNPENEPSGIVGKKTIITISGGYGDILRFLSQIQNYQRKVWIESFRLDSGGNTGKLKCQVVLTVYCVERVEATLYEKSR